MAVTMEGSSGFCVSGDAHGLVRIWNVGSRALLGALQFSSEIACLSIDRNDARRLVVSEKGRGEISLVDLYSAVSRFRGVPISSESFPRFVGSKDFALQLVFSNWSDHLISASHSSIDLWRLDNRQLVRSTPHGFAPTKVFVLSAHPTLNEISHATETIGLLQPQITPNIRALQHLTASSSKAWAMRLPSRTAFAHLLRERTNNSRKDLSSDLAESLWKDFVTTDGLTQAVQAEQVMLQRAQDRFDRSVDHVDSLCKRLRRTPPAEESAEEAMSRTLRCCLTIASGGDCLHSVVSNVKPSTSSNNKLKNPT